MSTNYWSGEPIVAERKDLHAANCMAVDRSGQLAVLAGRRQVSLVDLQHPRDTVHALHWQHKYDAGTAAWSRAACDTHNLAVSYNNQVSMLRLAAGEGGGGGLQLLQESRRLQSHRRGITDLDWHWREPLLATSSIDASIHVWDARDLRRTAAVMSSVETASQVKWNRMSDFTLASSHEGDIRVWDTRKLNIPERYISAHTAKIHSLDWSPNQEHELVTAGQDMYVKFIDVTNPHAVVNMTKSKDPVWRARYTPFGNALVTVGVLPHLRRGDNCPCLWNTDSLTTPVHTFMGHTDVVLEFDWRHREAEADYELITWSRDQSLRLWQVEHHLLQLCGHEVVLPAPGLDNTDLHQYSLVDDNVFVEAATPPEPTATVCPNGGAGDASVHVSPPPAPPLSPPFARSRRAASEGPPTAPVTLPRTLQQEFAMVNKNIDNVRIENLDPRRRTCQVSVGCGPLALSLLVTFPASYPSIVPEMKVLEETGLSEEDRLHIHRCWRLTAEQHVKRNSSCLEPCLRTLATELQSRAARGTEFKATATVPPQYPDSLQATATVFPSGNLYGNFKDMNVPFPRTSGARFCGNGTLVVFACPAYMKRLSTRGDNATPRSLSALDAYLMNYTQSGTVARGLLAANAVLYPSLSRSPTTTDSPLQTRVAASSLGRRLKPSSSTVGVTTGSEVRPAVRSASSTPAAVSAAVAASAAVTASSAAATSQQLLPALVICYDCSRLALLSPQLAVQYRLPVIRASAISTSEGSGGRGVSFGDVCGQNAMRAAAAGRRDLERLWKLVGVACEPSATPTADAEPDAARPWAQHVFGRQLVERLLDHYLKLRDIQTVAMLLCTVGTRTRPVYCSGRRSPVPPDEHSPGESPYHTVHPTESRRYPALHGLTFGAGPGGRQNRSNSWTDDITSAGLALQQQSTAAGGLAAAVAAQAVGCSELAVPDGSAAERKHRQHENNCRILDPSRQTEFENYIGIYASLLYKWQLLNQRAQVLKYVTAAPAGSQYGIELRSECGRCGHVFTGPECSTCKRYSITCAVCHTPVRGMSAFCLSCGHGGHLLHMWQWFESQPVCPAGCPCKCLHTFQNTFEAV